MSQNGNGLVGNPSLGRDGNRLDMVLELVYGADFWWCWYCSDGVNGRLGQNGQPNLQPEGVHFLGPAETGLRTGRQDPDKSEPIH